MGKLISGKDAAIRYLNGENILHLNKELVGVNDQWADCKGMNIDDFKDDRWAFKLKPQTITLNGIEVPAPFDPKEGDWFYYINDEFDSGYSSWSTFSHNCIAVWRTEDEIKQVVEALRSIFNVK